MATVASPPNLRLARAYASMGAEKGAHPPSVKGGSVGAGGGGGRASGGGVNPIAAGLTPEQVQQVGPFVPYRPGTVMDLLTGSSQKQAQLAYEARMAQAQMSQQARAAVGAFQQAYAQTGNPAQAMSALMRHPGMYDLIGSGLLGKNPLQTLITLSATPKSPTMRDLGNGMTAVSNFDAKGNEKLSLHNNPRPVQDPLDKGQIKTVVGPDGKPQLQYVTPRQLQGGEAPQPYQKPGNVDGQTMRYLSSVPQLYQALDGLQQLSVGGAAGTGALKVLAARYGVGTNTQEVIGALQKQVEASLMNGALGGNTRAISSIRDFMKNVTPQNVYAQSFNHQLLNGLLSDIRQNVQGRVAFAEQKGGPLPRDVAMPLEAMGVHSQGGPGLLGKLQGSPDQLSADDIQTLYRSYDLTPQQKAAVGQLIQQRMKAEQTGPDGQEAAGGKGMMPSESDTPPGGPSPTDIRNGAVPRGQGNVSPGAEQMPSGMQQQQQANDQAQGMRAGGALTGASVPMGQPQSQGQPGAPAPQQPTTGQSIDPAQAAAAQPQTTKTVNDQGQTEFDAPIQ